MGVLNPARSARSLLAAASSVACLIAAGGVGAEPGEYDVKAAFLLNFARMVEWPPASDPGPGEPLVVCVRASAGVRADVSRTLLGKTRGENPIEVRAANASADLPGCHLLFVTEEYEDAVLLASADRHHVLSVGESETFIRAGGVMAFRSEGGKLRFDFRRAAAEEAGLKASSKLLRLAGLVD